MINEIGYCVEAGGMDMGMTDTEEILHDRLNKIISKLKSSNQSNVVLIGDVMLDCYIHGFANNLNSRAPVPVLRETSREEDALVDWGFNDSILGGNATNSPFSPGKYSKIAVSISNPCIKTHLTKHCTDFFRFNF